MKNEHADLDKVANTLDASSTIGYFMGSYKDVLGVGVFNIFGGSLFSSAKNSNGDLGLAAFKSLLGLVGSQIDYILPAEANVQFIAPNDILVGVSKISTDKINIKDPNPKDPIKKEGKMKAKDAIVFAIDL